jgi:excisionase family DNA binding protein
MLTALVLPRRDRNSTSRPRPHTYTVEQAAEILGISRSHAYACVKSGEITSLRLRRRIVIPAHVLDALLGHAAPTAGSEFRDK